MIVPVSSQWPSPAIASWPTSSSCGSTTTSCSGSSLSFHTRALRSVLTEIMRLLSGVKPTAPISPVWPASERPFGLSA